MSDLERLNDDVGHADAELVRVFETSEPDVLPVIKSILDAAEIPYSIDGEGLMNTFPSEANTGGNEDDLGEVRIFVQADRAEEARALLSEDFQLAETPAELENMNEEQES